MSNIFRWPIRGINFLTDQMCQLQLIYQCLVGGHSTMDRLTILVCRPNKSVTPTNYFFKVPIDGRFMPLVGMLPRPVESQLKSQHRFKNEQKVTLPTKDLSLRLRNHNSTGRLSLFWLLPTEKYPTAVQSCRPNNKSLVFFTKKLNMSNIFCRPIRGLFSRPDRSF